MSTTLKSKAFRSMRKSQRRAKALKMAKGRVQSLLGLSKPAGVVVMFHIGRSGSTVLCDLLAQHPSILWDGEAMSRYNMRWEKAGKPERPRGALEDALSFLDQGKKWAGPNYYGFETKFYQLDPIRTDLAEFVDGVRGIGATHFILLKRNNYLRKVISSLTSKQAKRWHQSLNDRPTLTRVAMDVDDVSIDKVNKPLLTFFEEWDLAFSRLEQLLIDDDVLQLSYEEDIANDPRRGYLRTCEFLGLEPQATQVRYGKTSPFPLTEMLSNYDEVATALRKTRYAWMLDEATEPKP